MHEQLEAGASDQEILDYMVARYGEFVRYRPEFSSATAALWLAPLILLALAAVVVALLMRGRGARDEALNAEDEAALAELLAGEKDSQ